MNRQQRQRLAAIEDALPPSEDIEVAKREQAEQQARQRVQNGSATPEDFTLIWDTPSQRRWFLARAGEIRYLFTRGLPGPSDLWTAAGLLVSWPYDDTPPTEGYSMIREIAQGVDPAARGGSDWIEANMLLALLGPDQGAGLRCEYHANLDRYDPRWRSLHPEGGVFEDMAARVEAGTADERDHFFAHMRYIRIYRNEFMVLAVGHRLARQDGETVYLTEPRDLAAELLSYFPEEEPPADLWGAICQGGDRVPTAESIAEWREFNRCRVVLGRWDHGKHGRAFLADNWSLYEAEYRYLDSRGELP